MDEPLLIAVSRYYTQIKPFIEKFGRDKVLVLDFEDLKENIEQVVEQTSTFLGVDEKLFPEGFQSTRSNVSLGNKRKHHKLDQLTFSQKVVRKVFPKRWKNISDNSDRSFSTKPKLTNSEQQIIRDLLYLEILEVEKLLGKDLSEWKK